MEDYSEEDASLAALIGLGTADGTPPRRVELLCNPLKVGTTLVGSFERSPSSTAWPRYDLMLQSQPVVDSKSTHAQAAIYACSGFRHSTKDDCHYNIRLQANDGPGVPGSLLLVSSWHRWFGSPRASWPGCLK